MSATLDRAQALERLNEWEDFIEGHHKEDKSEEEFCV
jgi:hypothetical protein